MYVGRIVAIGKNQKNKMCAMYRVSSRSFPNREARMLDGTAVILPKKGYEDDIKKNPFIAYHCLRVLEQFAIVSNGVHTDPLYWKLRNGVSMRDALVTILHSFDYEQDDLNTPRIAGIIDVNKEIGYLGIVTKESLHVQEVKPGRGRVYFVTTYDQITPGENQVDCDFDVETAEMACGHILGKGIFSEMENPVTAACAVSDKSGIFDIATHSC